MRYKTLSDKYENSKFYKKVYQRHADPRSHHDIQQNYAGFYINLSHLMDFGKSMFSLLQDNSTCTAQNAGELAQVPSKTTIPEEPALLVFDSKFESGNLYAVFSRQENVYDLVMQNDINTKGYTQWFFFSVTNTRVNQMARFNIVNFVGHSPHLPPAPSSPATRLGADRRSKIALAFDHALRLPWRSVSVSRASCSNPAV